MEFFLKYIDEFWKLTLEMAPWLLLGLLIAGVLKSYFPAKKINKHLGKNNVASVLKAAFIGVPMPLCSCGVLPTGISLYKGGASTGATNAFLISTPQTGIDSILATNALMGWPLAIIRPFIAFITGIFGGILTNIFNVKNAGKIEEKEITKTDKCCGSCGSNHSKENKLKTALHFAFIEMIKDIGKWLVIGLALASFISVLMPYNFIQQYIGSGFIEMLVIIVVSIPLYICATASIPIASSLILKGLSPGAAIVFLMAGSATNIASLTVIKKTIGTKFMWLYLLSIILGALFFGFLINIIFPPDFFTQYISTGIMHHNYTNIIYTISGIILISLIFYALFLDRYFNKKTIKIPTTKIIKVEKISCNHCKNDLEEKVSSIKGVTKAIVHLQNQEVHVEGNFDFQNIKQLINHLGYKIIE